MNVHYWWQYGRTWCGRPFVAVDPTSSAVRRGFTFTREPVHMSTLDAERDEFPLCDWCRRRFAAAVGPDEPYRTARIDDLARHVRPLNDRLQLEWRNDGLFAGRLDDGLWARITCNADGRPVWSGVVEAETYDQNGRLYTDVTSPLTRPNRQPFGSRHKLQSRVICDIDDHPSTPTDGCLVCLILHQRESYANGR